MKKILLVILTLSLLLFGCSAPEEAPEPKEDIVAAEETVECHITGSFSATVRHLIPDYCLDSTTLNTAVVTLFQDGPIALYVGEEIASELAEGEIYVFTVKDTETRTVSKEEFDLGFVDVKDAMVMKNVRVDSARPAEENELGLDSDHLKYEIIE